MLPPDVLMTIAVFGWASLIGLTGTMIVLFVITRDAGPPHDTDR